VELIPLSAVNHYLYCPRRAALIHVEGIFEENQHTIRGELAHEHADLPGYEVAKGVTLFRALPVWSERLGLSGKCDIVEMEVAQATSPAGSSGVPPDANCGKMPLSLAGQRPALRSLRPVEYKRGKRRQYDNDDAQLCAQALCLEEMFGITVERGAVFHATSKRRREVEFTAELRQLTENAIAELHTMLNTQLSTINPQLPQAVFKPACEECSLFEICLPKMTSAPTSLQRAARRLFEI
jgi:CRISPR-associated exonuclease Cas4